MAQWACNPRAAAWRIASLIGFFAASPAILAINAGRLRSAGALICPPPGESEIGIELVGRPRCLNSVKSA